MQQNNNTTVNNGGTVLSETQNKQPDKSPLLQKQYNFQFKHFDFNLYPEHVNLKKYNGLNCSYAFKPIIIYNEANGNVQDPKTVRILHREPNRDRVECLDDQ